MGHSFYSITFEERPFGLNLKALHEQTRKGAMVAEDHVTRDICKGSRVISINGVHCGSFSFERIKEHCRKATFPATIKFSKKTPEDAIEMIAATMASLTTNTAASTTSATPNSSKARKLKKQTKSKREERESALKVLALLDGMKSIKKGQKFERDSRWKECVESYSDGVGQLEKSLKSMQGTGTLTKYQHVICQQKIDQYCRALTTIQREHGKEIRSSAKKKLKRTVKSPKSKTRMSAYETPVDEQDEAAVFGAKNSKKKRESAVSLKRKEMARMKREMETGKVEKPKEDEGASSKESKPPKVDLFASMEADFQSKERTWKNKKKGVKSPKSGKSEKSNKSPKSV